MRRKFWHLSKIKSFLAALFFYPISGFALPTLPDTGNLLYWFSADTDVWSDSNATTTATDGVDVQVWRDQISNLKVTSPATSSDRSPTYVVNGIGNQPSLDFNTGDGGIDAMLNNSIASSVTAKTIFIVFQPNSEITTSDSRQVLTDGWSGLEMLGLGDFHGSANANATTKSVVGLTSKTTTSSSQGVGVGYGPAKLSAAQPHVLTAVWNINTQEFDLYLDGINVGNSRRFLTADTNGFSLQELTIGARNLGALDGFEGMISEVIFYKTSLSDSNRLEVGLYLSNKYLVPSLNKAFHFSADTEVWSDSAATTAAADGQDVQLWQDQSANNIDLIPSNPGTNRAATYRENGINGKPALQFNNETAPNETTPDKMQNTGYNGTLKTLFYVFQPDHPISNTTDFTQRQVLLFGGSEINTVSPHNQISSAHIGLNSNNGTVNRAWGYDPADSLDIPAYPTVLSISWHASDEQYDLRMNGASVGNLTSGIDPNAFVMSGLFVGAHSSGAYGLQGLVAEIIAYESELPTGQRDAIEQYLKGKYAAPNTYYVDASNGVDEDSGLSPTSPWKSFDRINDSLLIPGDTILLKRGETWRETITVPSSGSPGLPVTFRAYGNGAKPIIHGGRPGSESWSGPDGNNVYSMENQPAGVYFMAESNELIKYASDANCNDGNWFREGAKNNVAQKTGTIYYKPTTGVFDPNVVEFVTTYVGILVKNQSYIEFYDLALTLLERGIYPYAFDTSVQNIKISNSDFSKIGNGIIFIARDGNESADSEISDNTFSNNRESIALYAFSNGVEISRNFLVTRNTLLNAGIAAGTQLWHDFASGDWEGIGFQNLNDSVISHNYIDGPGVGAAINLWTNSQSTAKNNQYIYNYIENIYGSGIVPGGQNGTDTGGHTVAYNIVLNSGYGAAPYGGGGMGGAAFKCSTKSTIENL